MAADFPLAAGFEATTRAQWVEAVDAATRGRGVEGLTVRLTEGFDVLPLLTPEDDVPLAHLQPTPGGPWGIRVVVEQPDPRAANRVLLDDLARGATQAHVRLDLGTRDGSGDARGVDGVAVVDAAAMADVLQDVLLDVAPVSLDAGASFLAAGRALLSLAVAAGPEADVRLGADPIGALAATGSLPQGIEQALADLATLAQEAVASDVTARAVAVDTTSHHDAGATDELDLGICLATAVTYLRVMTAAGMDIHDAADQIEFRIAVGVDQFLGIAKVRALRQLFLRVLELSGATPRPATVHVALGRSLVTRRDPWGNLLRGTIACFAAGVGGADSVTVPPLDSALGLPGELGRRVARNTQLVLQREAHLARFEDPAAGSLHVEALTDELCRAAWTTFQRIEDEGGMLAALVDGHVHDAIERRLAVRVEAVVTRRRPITGVSEFALLDERVPQTVEADPADLAHLPPSDFLPRTGPWTQVPALALATVAGPFEALRDAADAMATRPRILLANIGPVARHTARATFAANAFAAGGIEAVTSDGFDEPRDAVAALADAGTDLAVVCGDDEQYAESGAAFVAALQSAGATVFLASRPLDDIPADGWVHLGVDLPAVLVQAQAACGTAGAA